ncbi:hypothetical protein [Sphaerisporangium corydalis]|uniref:Uncharacterized protein n=1 Tax=Sphaerisporangium corydalis TaxID=1441875 RepID=A0ABV9EIL3_9ACTN|nr:hypothetical protein [Sphaerisporangium corydalis]
MRTANVLPLPVCDRIPPPAYFVRSVPIMPTGRWMRAKVTSQGPFVAGLALALATGAGLGLGLTPSCPLTTPFSDQPGLANPHQNPPGSGLPYIVQWQPIPPTLLPAHR